MVGGAYVTVRTFLIADVRGYIAFTPLRGDEEAALPLVNRRGFDFVSARVGNYQHHPQWGLLIGQLWVK